MANSQRKGNDNAISTVPARSAQDAGQDPNQRKPLCKKGSQPDRSTDGAHTKRIWALDFTKGALVLVMVLYHWLNYFVGSHGFFYRYLLFLPPSFICISGFLISQVYASRFRITGERVPRRMVIRGLKVLAIFILLNVTTVGVLAFRSGSGKGWHDFLTRSALWSVFVSGNMTGGRLVAFYILLPISYLLILSACIMVISRRYRNIYHVVTIIALMAIMILRATSRTSPTLELMSVGCLGISAGYISIEKVDRFLKRPHLILLAYVLYILGITLWNTPYPLQVIGVLLTLMLIYRLGTASSGDGQIPQLLALLGKYSLFGYIAQIAILQCLRGVLRVEYSESIPAFSLVLAVILTVISVIAVDRARTRVSTVDHLYRVVFS